MPTAEDSDDSDGGLVASVRPVLESILLDYPGGQLLEEALQNAEDQGAASFSLMLDLRQHAGVLDPMSGPAFVLVDSGSGFGRAEWRSLRHLHDSGKKENPASIGQFGMGSRSYFHYSDLIQVFSNKEYVGLDPLRRVVRSGRRSDSWHTRPDAAERRLDLEAEAKALFFDDMPAELRPDQGAAFRLPLRRAQDVATGLGPAYPATAADDFVRKWVASLSDGRLLPFLSHLKRVSRRIYRRGFKDLEFCVISALVYAHLWGKGQVYLGLRVYPVFIRNPPLAFGLIMNSTAGSP